MIVVMWVEPVNMLGPAHQVRAVARGVGGVGLGCLTLSGVLRFAPPSRSTASASAWPVEAAMKAGVLPSCGKGG